MNMAEFDIGTHCQVAACNQLDFLPFMCDGCSRTFCLEHREPYSHDCSCCTEEAGKKSEQSDASQIISYPCSIDYCKSVELVPVNCSLCNKQFCLKHRIPEDHKCSLLPVKKQFNPSTSFKKVDYIAKQGKAPKTRKAAKLAAKVALMKLKLHSRGDKGLPEEERVYFSVHALSTTHPIYLSKNWTIGKSIDFIADMLKIPNNNHKSNETKLKLFSSETKEVIPSELLIEYVIVNELLINGSTITLALSDD